MPSMIPSFSHDILFIYFWIVSFKWSNLSNLVLGIKWKNRRFLAWLNNKKYVKQQIILIFGLFRKAINFIQWETKQSPKSTSTVLPIKSPDQTSRPKAISRPQYPRYKNLPMPRITVSSEFTIPKWKTMNRWVALLKPLQTREQARTNGNWNKKSTSMRHK